MKKQKLLFILNIANRVNNFSYTSMIAAQELGIEFHIAGNWSYKTDAERKADEKKYNIKIHQIDFIRTPYHPGNIKAYFQLKNLIQKEKYDIIHCNTPIGGVLGRIVGNKCKVKNIIYQVHGFHFYQGAPKKNWLIYYPVEKWLAHKTNAIVTINKEDYKIAQKMKLKKGGRIFYAPGVGIDLEQYKNINSSATKSKIRSELGIKENSIVCISTGDLIKRKNYSVAISAISGLRDEYPDLHYLICGIGPELDNLKSLVKKNHVENMVHFLGFRNDIKELLIASDIFLFSSLQEGLSRSLMEAMANGLPCVVSRIRGNVDLIQDGIGGFLCDPNKPQEFTDAIKQIAGSSDMYNKMRISNLKNIKAYSIEIVVNEIKKIYKIYQN